MKPVVVFSHGFGVRFDDRGLFTDIADAFGDAIVPVMFDFNEVSEDGKTLTVQPFSSQVENIKSHVDQAAKDNPGVPLYVVGHSQGCLVAAMANLPAEKVIMLAPAPELNVERLVKNFSDRPGVHIDLHGTSKLTRRDGTTTLIGADYVKEIQAVRPVESYNELAKNTEVVMVKAGADEVLGEVSYDGIEGVAVQEIPDANHDFTGPARAELIELLKKEIS